MRTPWRAYFNRIDRVGAGTSANRFFVLLPMVALLSVGFLLSRVSPAMAGVAIGLGLGWMVYVVAMNAVRGGREMRRGFRDAFFRKSNG